MNDAIRDTWCENGGIPIQVGHVKYVLSVYWCVNMASDIRKSEA